jgi:hypothetical protein
LNVFQQNGFVYSDGEAKLHFELEGWGSDPTEEIDLSIFGVTYCGDTISFNFNESLPKVELFTEFNAIDSLSLCDTVPYSLNFSFLDTSSLSDVQIKLAFDTSKFSLLNDSTYLSYHQ